MLFLIIFTISFPFLFTLLLSRGLIVLQSQLSAITTRSVLSSDSLVQSCVICYVKSGAFYSVCITMTLNFVTFYRFAIQYHKVLWHIFVVNPHHLYYHEYLRISSTILQVPSSVCIIDSTYTASRT